MTNILLIISICLEVILLVVLFIFLLKKNKSNNNFSKKDLEEYLNKNNDSLLKIQDEKFKNIKDKLNEIEANNNKFQYDFVSAFNSSISDFKESLNKSFKELNESFDKFIEKGNENSQKQLDRLNGEFKAINNLLTLNNNENIKSTKETLEEFRKNNNEKLNEIKETINNSLNDIRKDNSEKLDKIQNVVDEKLQKTLEDRLNQSFKNVFDQINNLNTTIGQIQTLATDVSSLKNVLANVKTKGIIGEVILGNLISNILTTDQYEENVITKKGSTERVEFAIKLPGEGSEITYLPIDSKFPTESYKKIQEAFDNSDKEALIAARKELRNRIKSEAKDIRDKYIDAPNTTNFAIMFLPIEGLYSEVINLGMFEEIQKDYQVIISGPSTFSALLNALQMGFKTVLIQKKSKDLYNLLCTIKTEFNKFADALDNTQKKIDQASGDLEKLVGTRTRVMKRKLELIDSISTDSSLTKIEDSSK